MIDSVSASAPATPVVGDSQTTPQATALSASASSGSSATPETSAAVQPSTRLLIEPNGAQGYVYRLVDSITGRLLIELPREKVSDLTSSPGYAAGALISRSV